MKTKVSLKIEPISWAVVILGDIITGFILAKILIYFGYAKEDIYSFFEALVMIEIALAVGLVTSPYFIEVYTTKKTDIQSDQSACHKLLLACLLVVVSPPTNTDLRISFLYC